MIKVLIVEDDTNKLRKMTKVLSDIDGITIDDIDTAINVHSAKRQLRETVYDLLVLDIILPTHIDKEVDEQAGIKLLEEIMERQQYKRPTHIIGITASEDILTIASERFSQHVLRAIYYDPTSDQWERDLRAHAQHSVMAKRDQSGVPVTYKSHLAIICALPDPELSSIRQLNWAWEQVRIPNDHTIYYKGEFTRNGAQKVVYAAAAPRMGMPTTAALAMKMISQFRPEYLAMTGITAGIPGKMELVVSQTEFCVLSLGKAA